MSHLINKDFLPGLIIIINQRVTNFVSKLLLSIFNILIRFSSFFGVKNFLVATIILKIYNISNWFLLVFYRYFLMGFYRLLQNFSSRSIEYRCDRQSAKAFGGINMAAALSFLGKSGYFTLFSTHPSTKIRIKKAQIVEEKNAFIVPSFISQISNLFSIMILPTICLISAHICKLDLLLELYISKQYPELSAILHSLIFNLSSIS